MRWSRPKGLTTLLVGQFTGFSYCPFSGMVKGVCGIGFWWNFILRVITIVFCYFMSSIGLLHILSVVLRPWLLNRIYWQLKLYCGYRWQWELKVGSRAQIIENGIFLINIWFWKQERFIRKSTLRSDTFHTKILENEHRVNIEKTMKAMCITKL